MIRIAQEDVWGDRSKSWRTTLQAALRRVVERAHLIPAMPSHCCLAFQDARLYDAHYAALREAMQTGAARGVWDADAEAEAEIVAEVVAEEDVDIEL